MRLVILPAARRDLTRIWMDTQVRWGTDQADSYVAAINHRFDNIAAFPASYPEYMSKRGTFRKAAAGEHLIFYIVGDKAVQIVRVLHNRMDVDDILV